MNLSERIDLYGVSATGDLELLGLVLGDVHLAQHLLKRFGSLRAISKAGRAELLDAGLSRWRMTRLRAAIEIGKRTLGGGSSRLAKFNRSQDVAAYFQPRLASLSHEVLFLCLLDCRNRVFRIEQIAQGGLTGIGISPRDILQPAVREGAAGIILVHNHPSGDPTPSTADRKLTRRVAEAAALLGIALLDHVIVACEGHLSII